MGSKGSTCAGNSLNVSVNNTTYDGSANTSKAVIASSPKVVRTPKEASVSPSAYIFEKLHVLRTYRRPPMMGLDDDTIMEFQHDTDLHAAVNDAIRAYVDLDQHHKDLLKTKSETEIASILQSRICNFYSPDSVNPYVPLAAKGPWIITLTGCVIHDNGGYGMLGFGHNPTVTQCNASGYAKPSPLTTSVMANVMTASFAHQKLTDALDWEIGHRRIR
eukprot:CAMPEP_0184698210 /NCGR_PEP_ID=MMETSP0313-20130426/4913_1 /TAXON_ID=2792 /ORGANISM="Porphyridium aerugineum, Strain SAG 1380-2" /LENGTH=217 /DNA_ID=CAMNT_0027157121 /DNA_START=1 /DNA_END=650 /DNA_ORIENTATION=+